MGIKEKTKRLLISKSGGFCMNPNCRKDLFTLFESGKINSIEELAHIIGKSESGPRGESQLTERDVFENILVLCPSCHTAVDKNPEEFPANLLKDWKRKHIESIDALFTDSKSENRKHLRERIEKLLLENQTIFDSYGPHSEQATNNPLSDTATRWKRKSVEIILPNNRRIISLLENHYDLLNNSDKLLLEQFKRHNEDFMFNQISGEKLSEPVQFPQEFENILTDEQKI